MNEQIKKTTIIAVAIQKGGAGKTTTVVNIAAGFARANKKVLVVDLDSQANLSLWLGFEHDGKPTITELIVSSIGGMVIDYDSHIRHFSSDGFDYIPAFEESLKGIPSYLASRNDCTNILSKTFAADYFKKYDYIIFDCSSAADLLITNAFAACDKLLIPVQTDYLTYSRVENTLQTLVNIKKDSDILKYILGFIPTMYQNGTNHSAEILEALKDSYGELVLNKISYRTEVKNAVGYSRSNISKPNSKSGQEYASVVNAILKRLEG